MASQGSSLNVGEALTSYRPTLAVDVRAEAKKDFYNLLPTPTSTSTPHVSTNIFVAGVPSDWDENDLRELYKPFGDIRSTKVVKTKHFGFVMFRTADAAHAAINATHLTRPYPNCSTLLHVSIAMHDEGVDDVPNNRIFIRGLPQWATKEHIRKCFYPFGTVEQCIVLTNSLGQCRGSGFVQFSSVNEATAAVNASDSITIENWDHPLEVKYSETAEVRQQRQERNRQRQKSFATSPKYSNDATTGSVLSSPMSFYSQPVSMLSSSQGYPILGLPFPVMYQAPSPIASASAPPTQIVYPAPVMQTITQGLPLYQTPSMVVMGRVPVPKKGDLHLSGGPITDDLVLALLQPYGPIEEVKRVDGDNGVAVRMKDTMQHPLIVQQLNGTLFSNGQVLAAGLYA